MLSHVFFGYWDPISAFPRISFERLLYKRVKKNSCVSGDWRSVECKHFRGKLKTQSQRRF